MLAGQRPDANPRSDRDTAPRENHSGENKRDNRVIRLLTSLLILCALLLMTGCKSPELRADKFVRTASGLLEDGDTARAVLELRNALQLMPEHEQARLMLAESRRAEGALPLAAREYLALVRTHPENGAGHLALAEIALEQGDWVAVQKYASEAARLQGDTPQTRAVRLVLDYRGALKSGELGARTHFAAEAETLLVQVPRNIGLHRLCIDFRMRQRSWHSALEATDRALGHFPDNLELLQLRLIVLQKLGHIEAITRQLEEMIARFPEQEALPETLVGWYLHQDQPDRAEAFLRARAASAPDGAAYQHLIAFLLKQEGIPAALRELNAAITKGGPHVASVRAMRTKLHFRTGARSMAIAELEELVQEQVKSGTNPYSKTKNLLDLARMKHQAGDPEGAVPLLENILVEEPGNIEALKMYGASQIRTDRSEDAIATLRGALRNAPRDPQILSLMAAAHARSGDSDLQRQMLAAAVDASGAAPEESLRFARLLVSEERLQLARETLARSLQRNPDDISLLFELGMVHLGLSDMTSATRIKDTLARLSRQEGRTAAGTAHDAFTLHIREFALADPINRSAVPTALKQP